MKNIFVLLTACCLLNISQVQAQTNLALDFDGVNDRVLFSGPGGFISDYTFEFWIKNTDFAVADGNFDRILSVAPDSRYQISKSATGDIHVRTDNQTNNHDNLTNIGVGTWVHVAIVRAGAVLTVYKNGVFATTRNIGTNSLQMGSSALGANFNSEFATMQLDEFRFWVVARTQAQILATMNSSLGSTPGLLSNYNFNNPAATAGGSNAGLTTLTDVVGGLNGTLGNFALSGATSNWVCGAPALGGCAAIPTLSEWGLILLSLLSLAVLAAVVFMVSTQRALVPAGTAASAVPAAFVRSMPLNMSVLARVLLYLLPLTVAGFIAVHYFIGTNGALDFTGTVVSAVIVGYIAHLVISKGRAT